MWKRRSNGKWHYTGQNTLQRLSYRLESTASRYSRTLAEGEHPLEKGTVKVRPDATGPRLGGLGCSNDWGVGDETERAMPTLSLSESQQSTKVADGANE